MIYQFEYEYKIKKCLDCPCEDSGYCHLVDTDRIDTSVKPTWCPLKEVKND